MPFIKENAHVARAFVEAQNLSIRTQAPLSTGHLLLALLTFANRARILLHERRIDLDDLLEKLTPLTPEDADAIPKLRQHAQQVAEQVPRQAPLAPRASSARNTVLEIDTLHLLVAICRHKDCFARVLLTRAGVDPNALRAAAIGLFSGRLPRRYREPSLHTTEPESASESESQSTAIQTAPHQPEPQAASQTIPSSAHETSVLSAQQEDTPPAETKISSDTCVSKALETGAEAEKEQSLLETLGQDLVAKAHADKIDPVLCRESELERIVDVLGRRRANNPLLLGPPGVGKTAIVEGLAWLIARADPSVHALHDYRIVQIDTAAMLADTGVRGALSEKMRALQTELAEAKVKTLVFIDEIHTLIGAGADGAHDVGNMLKAALARGEFPCIGATTQDEFDLHFKDDPALARRFSPIHIDEPGAATAMEIIARGIAPYAKHHGVHYSPAAIEAAVKLSGRYLPERYLPDKGFAVIDLAGSRAKRRKAPRVGSRDVAEVLHLWTGIPKERLLEDPNDPLHNLEALLGQSILGHQRVLSTLAATLRRGFMGFHGHRPLASILLLGPTGVGKTAIAKCCAQILYGSQPDGVAASHPKRLGMIRIDMSEFSERHSVARLIGAQPGYIGFDAGGQLTEALKKNPYRMILFDEIEKAHPEVLNLLLQILDEGRLCDARGHAVSFAHATIVATSNLGMTALPPSSWEPQTTQSHPNRDEMLCNSLLHAAQQGLSSELWARFDQRLVLLPLKLEQLVAIAEKHLQDCANLVHTKHNIRLRWTDALPQSLAAQAQALQAPPKKYEGARGLRRHIQEHIEGPMAEFLGRPHIRPPQELYLSWCDERGLTMEPRHDSSTSSRSGAA